MGKIAWSREDPEPGSARMGLRSPIRVKPVSVARSAGDSLPIALERRRVALYNRGLRAGKIRG